jgi:hypothetical protein
VDFNDQTLSHLAQPLVRIALNLLQLFRAHRATHAAGGGPYVPPDDAVQNDWMANDHDLVVAVQELDTEFTTQYVKDRIDATTGAGSAGNTAKRAMKRYLLLKRVNSLMRDGLLEAVKGQALLSHKAHRWLRKGF